MDLQRLLIIDPSEIFTHDLTRRLEGSFQIKACHDGYTAQSLICTFQPHVVVMDLMMKGLDGAALTECIRHNEIQPKILITTFFMTPFIERLVRRIPFDYLMYKPCDSTVLADRICEISADPCRDIIMPTQAQACTAQLLQTLNVSANHKGYRYLLCAVEIHQNQPDCSMTKDIYPAIGRRFNIRADAVERDIRRAIGAAWVNCDSHIWRMYFDSDRNGDICRPTNTVFISTIAQRLALRNVI